MKKGRPMFFTIISTKLVSERVIVRIVTLKTGMYSFQHKDPIRKDLFCRG